MAAGGGGDGGGPAVPVGSGDASGVAVALGVAVADASGVAVAVVSGTGSGVTVGVGPMLTAAVATGAELSGVGFGGEAGIDAEVAPTVAVASAVAGGRTVGLMVGIIGVVVGVGGDGTPCIGVTVGTRVACNGLKTPATLGPEVPEAREATMANNESPGDTALNSIWPLDCPLTQVDRGIQPSESLANVMASGSWPLASSHRLGTAKDRVTERISASSIPSTATSTY